jgi:Asp-tRNA(Asn)/Glu-tRNA(Gln) amidotransferase A subunit family amidase
MESSRDHETLVSATSLSALASNLRSGAVELAEQIDLTERRVNAVNRQIKALLPEHGRWSRLRRDAAALAAKYARPADRPALYGVPVAVKDLFAVDGLPTHAGTSLPADLFAGPEASIVTALRRAGALMLGKSAMDELAYSEPPATRNPHNLEHTPGGSSGGSAAAVASGMCPLALGTQTSRSVIGPAAFCGVVGFKPSFGRMPIDGVVPLSPSFDTIGLLTSDVAGMMEAAAALVPGGCPRRPIKPCALGVPTGKLMTWTLPKGLAAYDRQVEHLRDTGIDVRHVKFLSDDELVEIDRVSMSLLHGEMARVHAVLLETYRDRLRPRTRRGIERGQRVSDTDLDLARELQGRLREQVQRLMDHVGIDAWLTPASAGPAPVGLELTGWGGMTTVWSFAGLPCITVPSGYAASGLPVGLQAIARFGDDDLLLDVAARLEAAFAGEHSRS